MPAFTISLLLLGFLSSAMAAPAEVRLLQAPAWRIHQGARAALQPGEALAAGDHITTGAGARVVLLNYLMPRDVLKALALEEVTGLTAVPPLYIQLTQLEWPATIGEHLRYFANTGGRMPRETLAEMRSRGPRAEGAEVPGVGHAPTFMFEHEIALVRDFLLQ